MAGQPEIVRGTGLELADLAKGRVFTVSDVPRLHYAWDAGEAIGRYLDELRNGRLVARKCHGCRRTLIPPRMFCERCFRPTDEWVFVQDTGTVNTFSLCYVSWDVRRLKRPEIPAVIEVDGASPGMGLLHVLGRVAPKAVHVGMRVRAVWKPARERIGSITDIRFFEPIPAAPAARRSRPATGPRERSGRPRRAP